MSIHPNQSNRFRTRTLSTLALCLLTAGAIAAPAKKAVRKAAPAAAVTAAAATAVAYAGRSDAMQLADEIAARRDLPVDWVRAQLSEARNMPVVTRLVTPAGKTFVKNWTVYRSRFIDPVRIRAGVQFWQANRQALARAEQQFGVPAEIIVGIIGVETIYGRNMGNFRVMDALATLALDFPQAHPRAQARSDYFRGELEQVLVTASRTGSDPFALRGSYAGAMGLGQFMPTSWDKYAVDFDGDGRIDLFNSATDAIGSVANYFVGHGWKPGLPTAFTVDMRAQGENLATLLAPDINPTFTAAQMAEREVRVLGADSYERPLALIELKNGSSGPTEYIAGTENFYVITRYNWSAFYALSVIELGREVHEAYLASQTASAKRN
ncbi:lytic transglycosylase [Comamonas testosteroni TK102]|uniref:Lytic transglycosylase n=1 Tax=Comamonas testosteroni TK102 TaxID=1392005 RepID=A0A076PU32_COMTE|nr:MULTISPECIES: lytic murein transglycosylase B [Comamonas]AIJ48181.1 lytic transglycosylase [Comamonas testosteroni TK102]MPS91054.1 lytic murein transglycosylase B [Comamonas sp.]